jgi:VanZ family protein
MTCCSTFRAIHVAVFAAFLIAWTVVLLLPVPAQSAERVLGSPYSVFLFGKGLHITAYAFLAVLGGTVALFGRRWIWILPGLVAHGGLTEILQSFTGRTSRIEDVGLDTIGVAVGALIVLGWHWFRKLTQTEAIATPGSVDPEPASQRHPLPIGQPSRPNSVDSD